LEIVSEYKGEMNDKPLRSIVAMNKSLMVFAGSLREIHISILGAPDDYAVEVASGAWFGSILFPGAVGLIIGGPIGLAVGAAFGSIMAYGYEKHIWKKIFGSGKKRKQGSANSRFYRPLLYKCCVNLMYCEGIKNGER
jgi:hypothetical protein